jgi:hypothetical protein
MILLEAPCSLIIRLLSIWSNVVLPVTLRFTEKQWMFRYTVRADLPLEVQDLDAPVHYQTVSTVTGAWSPRLT